MSFAPMETKTLFVQYRIPMTMGLGSTQKDEMAPHSFSDPLEQELVNIAMEEVVGYITSTGSSWAGNVDSATFTVITEPFERYLDVRGIGEEPPGVGEAQGEDAKRYRQAFPVLHPWWFRTVSPAGWKKVDHGLQWTYEDFKPQDSIVLSYYMTELPRLPEEVSPFINQFLENFSGTKELAGRDQLKRFLDQDGAKGTKRTSPDPVIELPRLRELILATYGKEPEDESVKQIVAAQIWYESRKEFNLNDLTKIQQAVLAQFDVHIAKAQSGTTGKK
jgi:hypothetical protein